ncbi:sodium:proton exchanger [Chloroflexia bacterium SDU3-3]|nr:sodium:proton exchanger [Chloroflexia bacterium SDU3-3]
MHHFQLLIDIAMALVAAFAGGLLARRLGLPTIVGYLLAGMAIGPFTPGFVGNIEDISQLAELGVIFLMFGVGLHFSLRDLWAVRSIAIPGALLQMGIAAALGFGMAQLWGWSIPASLVLGLAISIASTVVLLRGLMDSGQLNTQAGQVAVGWLVLEDLATILILVFLPVLFAGEGGITWQSAGVPLLKAAVFVAAMLLIGGKLLPWLLTRIAFTGSRELFILAVVAAAVGTAISSAELFGVSLALGAFLAGVVLGESSVSHQIGAEVLPFREIFAVVFFVSVGMLVNPSYLVANAGQVLALTALVVVGKAVITMLLGLVLPSSGRTILVVAAGLSQIGEFSFIVGQAGVGLGILSQDQYSLILASSLLAIVLNPLLFKLQPRAEALIQRVPWLWARLDRQGQMPDLAAPHMADHVVIVGYGRVGAHIVTVLQRLEMPYLVLESDARRAADFAQQGVPMLYGDAANSEILSHAGLAHARALVVTLPDEAAAEMVVGLARREAPGLPIIARAATQEGITRLSAQGVQDVIHPELEGGLEVVRHTLLTLGYPATQVQAYTDAVRHDQYDTTLSTDAERRSLDTLRKAMRGLDVAWRQLEPGSPALGQSLAEADMRAKTGASVIAIIREGQAMPNPTADTSLREGDILGVIGSPDQIAQLDTLLAPPASAPQQPAAPQQQPHTLPA